MNKPYSELSLLVDLIIDIYKITNPIIIAERIYEEFEVEYSIHQINDYLAIERQEDYEQESIKHYYQLNY